MSILGSHDVLPLALGATSFGWPSDEATSHAILDAFVDGGGSVTDTADSYGAGPSERMIGSWLAAPELQLSADEVARLTAASDQVGR